MISGLMHKLTKVALRGALARVVKLEAERVTMRKALAEAVRGSDPALVTALEEGKRKRLSLERVVSAKDEALRELDASLQRAVDDTDALRRALDESKAISARVAAERDEARKALFEREAGKVPEGSTADRTLLAVMQALGGDGSVESVLDAARRVRKEADENLRAVEIATKEITRLRGCVYDAEKERDDARECLRSDFAGVEPGSREARICSAVFAIAGGVGAETPTEAVRRVVKERDENTEALRLALRERDALLMAPVVLVPDEARVRDLARSLARKLPFVAPETLAETIETYLRSVPMTAKRGDEIPPPPPTLDAPIAGGGA
jgi:hypothetical protein